MADDHKPAPPKIPMPSLPKPAAPAMPAPPKLPMPSAPSRLAAPPSPPSLPPLHVTPPAPPQAPDAELVKRLAETEKRLHEEREKVLVAGMRQQEEKVYAAKVEEAIRDVQEKLRRDRREAQSEETRLELQTKIQELEQKLIQEREAWVGTLKQQVLARETQDRQIEAHFTSRMQEMERRWLEEKAHWQKVLLAKDEELRNLKTLCEKLKGVDVMLEKEKSERGIFERRTAELSQQYASAQAELKGAAEHEKEYHALKAELTVAREQARMLQDKLEREIQTVRIHSKEREERILADNERLQRDIQNIANRVRAEAEIEVRKHKSQADLAGAALQRMRAVGQALERQVAALRVQAEEAAAMKKEMQQLNERYKAEFIVLQRRWQEREKEIRHEAKVAADKDITAAKAAMDKDMLAVRKEVDAAKAALAHDLEAAKKEFETEKARIRLRAQDEVQARVERAEQQLRGQMEETVKAKEAAIRRELEHELETRGARLTEKLKAEIEALREELAAKEAVEKEKLIAKEAELASLRSALDELRGHLSKEQEWRRALSGEKEQLERDMAAHQDEVRRAAQNVEEMRGRLAKEEEWKRVLLQEKANLEKLVASLEAELRHRQATSAELPPQPHAEGGSGGLLGRLFSPKPEPPKPPTL